MNTKKFRDELKQKLDDIIEKYQFEFDTPKMQNQIQHEIDIFTGEYKRKERTRKIKQILDL